MKVTHTLLALMCSLALLSTAQADHRHENDHKARGHQNRGHQPVTPAPKQRPAQKQPRHAARDHDRRRHELLVHLDERIHFARRHKYFHLANEWLSWRKHVYHCNDFGHSHVHYWDRHYAKRDYRHYRRARRYYRDHYPRGYGLRHDHYDRRYDRHHRHHRHDSRHDRRGRRFSSEGRIGFRH